MINYLAGPSSVVLFKCLSRYFLPPNVKVIQEKKSYVMLAEELRTLFEARWTPILNSSVSVEYVFLSMW